VHGLQGGELAVELGQVGRELPQPLRRAHLVAGWWSRSGGRPKSVWPCGRKPAASGQMELDTSYGGPQRRVFRAQNRVNSGLVGPFAHSGNNTPDRAAG
jgi:hypothetical protein